MHPTINFKVVLVPLTQSTYIETKKDKSEAWYKIIMVYLNIEKSSTTMINLAT